jgi:voltage-gated potassium channel
MISLMEGILLTISRLISRTVKRFKEDRLPRIFVIFLMVIITAGIVAALVEKISGNSMYQTIGDGLWWAFVTMTTVGYGDKTPVTAVGRLLAIVIMFSGISFTALFTALVASYFVEKRIREGRGMEQIKWKQHIVMCGWNSHAMKIVNKLTEEGEKSKPLVLVNDLPEEHIANILEATKNADVKHVRGDFVHEGILQRANVSEADIVIILADKHSSKPEARPDDRTTLACFTARSLNRHARICAEKELLIGVVSEEEEGMGLDDILSGDMSAIDRFIKKKFEGMEDVYFTKRKSLHVKLNPSDDYIIRPNDKALVIAKEKS